MDEQPTPPTPEIPAAWYPDPSGGAGQRWWDGTKWTEHVHPAGADAAPNAASVAGATGGEAADGTAPAPKRSRRGLVIGLIAGGTAVLLVAGTVIGLNVAGVFGGDDLTTVGGYDYAAPMLDLERDHEFEFRAAYDLEAKASEVGAEEFDTDFAFEVFTDAALSKHAPIMVNQWNDTVTISAQEDAEARYADSDAFEGREAESPRIRDVGEAYGAWGLNATYYLVQHLDEQGAELDRPRVTPFTVQHELEAPTVTFATDGGTGNLSVAWQAVEGASSYLVVASSTNGNTREISVVGETDGETTWSTTDAVFDMNEGSKATWAIEQNVGLQLFDRSADELENDATAYQMAELLRSAEFDLGVIATDGTSYSPYISYDGLSVAGDLPFTRAEGATDELYPDRIVGVANLQSVPTKFAFTSLDGATRQSVAYADPAAVVEYPDYSAVGIRGKGTDLGMWLNLERGVDVAAEIAAFNARAEAEAPTTGGGVELVSAPVDEMIDQFEPSTTAPATDLPVVASNDFTRYLAANLIDRQQAIDVSAYVGAPGMPSLDDAIQEATEQNPYVVGVDGYGASDGILYVTYTASADDLAANRDATYAKAQEVVAEVITDGMGDAEKVTALNDWITANAEYDYEALAAKEALGSVPDAEAAAWQASGALVDGSAVCAGYAYAFEALALEAGLDAVVVTGDVTAGGRHAWNKVSIDGRWLAVDTTWNDDEAANQYLMITDAEFTGPAERTEDIFWMQDSRIGDYAAK
ncbi:DUF2510 domain-containing protein [Agromyces sp. Leaf222]|uniref:DUF2510 domain-containing protein n=1 Tax=Agromyces sp. Leaf222 TaxID=1735688 RepID=UPI0006FB3163|nr:DUF2510 domain-containing protein [Agromyces sp. Leaf222]KQM82489.1 hypothetical protein ASE68_03675 [Agromyces sp. Leaf222]